MKLSSTEVGTALTYDQPLVFAIDSSTWVRNDAKTYTRRFDLEHTFRFCKQTLNWETPRLRHT